MTTTSFAFSFLGLAEIFPPSSSIKIDYLVATVKDFLPKNLYTSRDAVERFRMTEIQFSLFYLTPFISESKLNSALHGSEMTDESPHK